MSESKPRGLGRLRRKLSAHPNMEAKFEQEVRPIIRDVRQDMQGQPEDAVHAELTRRLAAADVDVPEQMKDNLRNIAGRISRGEHRGD